MKPIIGITSNYSYDDKAPMKQGIGAPGQEWQVLADDYIAAVVRGGGIPFIIPLIDDIKLVEEILERIDGLILTGGNDINPKFFDERAVAETGFVITERDKQDIFCAKHIIEKTNKPLLGVCRGMQIMNVAFGGNMYQDLVKNDFQSHSLSKLKRHEGTHDIFIEKDSLLEKIVDTKSLRVNSFHHQGVKDIASNLKSVARSDDRVVEALELKDNNERFILGLQWHPEMMASHNDKQQEIITKFIKSCNE